MPATGAKRGNLVYHWRHGWIPRDHFAALSKAHHSKTGAVKVMQKHGIDVPKGYSSDHKPSAPTVAPKATPKATHAKVRDLPAADTFKGVHSETHMGERVTVRKGKQWGTIQTEVNGHVVGIGYGHSNADAVKHLDATKGTVAHAKANPGNYTNGVGEASYGMKLGAKASPAPTHSAGMDPHAIRATQLREAAAKKRAEAEGAAGNDLPRGEDHSKVLKGMADQLDANVDKFKSPESRRTIPLLTRALREGRHQDAWNLAARIDSAEAREFQGMGAPSRNAIHKVISAAGAAKRAAAKK